MDGHTLYQLLSLTTEETGSSNKRYYLLKKGMRVTEAATGGVLLKKVFLKVSKNSQENTRARVSFLIKLHALVL